MQNIKNIAMALGGELSTPVIVSIAKSSGTRFSTPKVTQIVRNVLQSSQQSKISAFDTSSLVSSFSQYDASKWDKIQLLGAGTYGTVSKMQRKSDENKYIVKKVSTRGIDTSTVREIGCYSILTAAGADIPKVEGLELKGDKITMGLELADTDLYDFAEIKKKSARIAIFDDVYDRCMRSLAQVHACGIIHCDIKPKNILIWLNKSGMTYGGTKQIEKLALADFGLASSRPDGGNMVYTSPYRAPELVEDDAAIATKETDIWALGATLLDFLTAKYEFFIPDENKAQMMTIREHVSDPTMKLLEQTNKKEQVLTMLATNPADRLVIDEPIYTFPIRKWKPTKHNRVVLLLDDNDDDTPTNKLGIVFMEMWRLPDVKRYGMPAFCQMIDIVCRYLAIEDIMEKNLRGICYMALSIATKWGSVPYSNAYFDLDMAYAACNKENTRALLHVFEQRIIYGLYGLIYIPGLEAFTNQMVFLDKSNSFGSGGNFDLFLNEFTPNYKVASSFGM